MEIYNTVIIVEIVAIRLIRHYVVLHYSPERIYVLSYTETEQNVDLR